MLTRLSDGRVTLSVILGVGTDSVIDLAQRPFKVRSSESAVRPRRCRHRQVDHPPCCRENGLPPPVDFALCRFGITSPSSRTARRQRGPT